MLVAVNLNASHTVALGLSWVVPPIFLLAVIPLTTTGKQVIQRWLCESEMRAARRVALAVLAFVCALIAFFPMGGYRVLPTKWENCFVQGGRAGAGWLGGDGDHDAFPGGTPCGKLSGEQRTP
jgi:hypothetical protein